MQMYVFYPIVQSYGNLTIQMSVFYPIARSYGNLTILVCILSDRWIIWKPGHICVCILSERSIIWKRDQTNYPYSIRSLDRRISASGVSTISSYLYKFPDTFSAIKRFVGENTETMQTKVPRANIKLKLIKTINNRCI